MPQSHRKAAMSIITCRTEALGGSLHQCEDCKKVHYAYHSCNHRNCPQCGQLDALKWEHKQQAKLLPIDYAMVTFTVPEEMRMWFRKEQKSLYHLFFKATSMALQETAKEKIGISLGMLGILHTWSRKLVYHPHIHYIVPLGGLNKNGQWQQPKSKDYFLPVKLLSRKVRINLQQLVKETDPKLFAKIPKSVWWKSWNSDIQQVGRGEKAMSYLARYVNQSALSSKRIVKDDAKGVTISYRPSGSDSNQLMTLSGEEFMRRYLQHVLPTGFKRIRYFGWLSPAAHKTLAGIRSLLNWKPQHLDFEQSNEITPTCCNACEGRLLEINRWYGNKSPPSEYYHAGALYV